MRRAHASPNCARSSSSSAASRRSVVKPTSSSVWRGWRVVEPTQPLRHRNRSTAGAIAVAGGSSADTSVTDTVVRYLEGCGGVASSRNVGRHLAAEGLLFTLKQKHAGLFHFLQKHDHLFQVVLPEERGALEYEVRTRASTSNAHPDWRHPRERYRGGDSPVRVALHAVF